MTKLRTGDPWMPAPEYGRSLRGLSVNLLVPEIEPALAFQREVLAATVVYSDPDIAVIGFATAEWMFHAHHTYDAHPLHGELTSGARRGIGTEIRLYGRDPDEAEAAARRLGYEVVQATADKPHGLREVFLRDANGYIWVPGVPLPR